MSKYIVKNCPAMRWDRKKFKVCYEGNKETKCCDIDDCVIKQIVGLCKENKFFGYGAVMLGNSLSPDILDLLGIEEVNE